MKILVVEDDQRILKNLKQGLEIHSYVVDTASDGLVGLDLALNESYDVIVLDLMLPSMDGLEICRQLRQKKVTTPVLMLTAKTQVHDRVTGLDTGADDYLGKPFSFSELLARLRALTRRPTQTLSQVLTHHDLRLDPTTQTVWRQDEKIELSKTEYVLLLFLLQHKGQVFSAEQLIERVWNFDSTILPNTVQVYIGYLRQKIDRPFPTATPLIQTKRGFGYTMNSE